MLSIALQVLAAWVAAAVIIGLMVGASIRSAEKLRKEEVLNDLFSYLAKKQSAREGGVCLPFGRASCS
jgi:hypothetical protein